MTTTLATIGTIYITFQVLGIVAMVLTNLVIRGQRRKLARLYQA